MEITKKDIVNVMKEVLAENTSFRKTETFINTTYNILHTIYIDKINNIILEAPTGTGKSVIGYMVAFCVERLESKLNKNEEDLGGTSYFLTSSKLLQDQIESDKDKFNFDDDILSILKGTANYPCNPIFNNGEIPENFPHNLNTYKNRFCRSMNKDDQKKLGCFSTCPYLVARSIAQETLVSVMNYSYFLTSLNAMYSIFGKRFLTISDECHLLPIIVNDTFNFNLLSYKINVDKIIQIISGLKTHYFNFINQNQEFVVSVFQLLEIFNKPRITFEDFVKYLESYDSTMKAFKEFLKALNEHAQSERTEFSLSFFRKDFNIVKDNIEKLIDGVFIKNYLESLSKRPQDILIMTEKIESKHNMYNHIIRDLDESNACKKYFLNNTNCNLFMSATIGNIDSFAKSMGLKNGEYKAFRLQSEFDFSNSPIYLVESGYLNYNSFQQNIDKVLTDVLKICVNQHKNHRGIIHTATFDITTRFKDLLNQKIQDKSIVERFLFYTTPEEKQECINLIKSDTNKNYIIVGPSLYEGISLDDDFGRFNILVKVPYQTLNEYTKAKMKRDDSWYNDITKEKIIQAIGRTNRNKNDWSKVYLMDSLFSKFIYQNISDNIILNRIKKF